MERFTQWQPLRNLRLKVTDRCPWNCWWCHNEGTGKRDPHSIGDIHWDEKTQMAIQAISEELDFTEIHLTGGEPTAHPGLPELISGLRHRGYSVKATSIGCKLESLRRIVQSGLQGMNFSFHAI